MAREVRPHYLRRNDTVWTPPAVIYLDTETRTISNVGQDVLVMRLWVARFIDRRPATLSKPDVIEAWGYTSKQLVEFIDRVFVGRKTVWLFAHNLAFDLSTTRLPMVMTDAGWQVSDAAIGGKAPWVRIGKSSRVLTVVDSGSWLPVKLDDIGTAIGIAKPELPDEMAGSDVWLGRCRADVDILATAMGQILDWWDEHGLGRFNITGPACGWNAFRHMWTVQRIVVNPEAPGVEADRLAVHGGRRGVWRVGRLQLGPLLELDFTAAYPRVAAELALPVRRAAAFDSLRLDDSRLFSDRWGVLAEVELETDVPRWPVRWHKATWYPVGRFRAHLAGPEIAEAARLGCLRAIGPGHVHQLGSVLMSWARWVLSVQEDQSGQHPPAARILAKHWGRTVIGKFSARSFDKVEMGASPVAGWGYEEGWDRATGSKGGYVDIAGRRWWVASGAISDNAYPAVHAWVESHVRVRLSRVLECLGDSAVIQCDTDGLITTRQGLIHWAETHGYKSKNAGNGDDAVEFTIAALNKLAAPLVIRVKRSYSEARILGPQHIEVPGERRFSGLPKTAIHKGNNRYAGNTWPKLKWQLSHGDPRGYVRPLVRTTVKGPFANGWVTSTGTVLPVMTVVTDDGVTEVVPWDMMPSDTRRHTLAPEQHRALNALTA